MSKTYIFTISVLTIGCILLGYRLIGFDDAETKHSGGDCLGEEAQKNLLFNIHLLRLESEGSFLKDSIVLTDSVGNEVVLADQVQKGQKAVVFRFSETNCQDCINQEIANLKELADQVGADKVLVITTYSDPRVMNVFRKQKKLDVQFLNLVGGSMGIPIEDYDVPYLFTLNGSMQVKNLFIPAKEFPKLSKGYYKFLENRFF